MEKQSQEYYGSGEGDSKGVHAKQWQSPPTASAYPSTEYPRHNRSDRDVMGSSPEGDVEGEAGRDDQGDGKKRRRIQQACKACSLRRVKCNGEKPCQTCKKNNDECVYGQPKKRGPAKGTTRSTRKEHSGSTSPHAVSKSSGSGSRRRMSSSNIPSQSPSSISASSHYQPLHAPPPPPSALAEAPPYATASTAYPYYRRSSAIGAPSASAYDRRFPHSSSVYRGGSSGWDGGFQGPVLKSQTTSVPPYHLSSRTYEPEGRPDLYNGSAHSSQWPSRSSSQRTLTSSAGNDTALQAMSEPRDASLFPLQGVPVIPPHQRTLRRRSLQVDELEVADEALSSIISSLPSKSPSHEGEVKRGDEDHSRRMEQKIGLQGTDITLNKPSISEEKKEQLFHVYWTVVSLYWPLFYRDASDDERQYRIRCEKEHPFLFNAICSTSALVLSESSDDKGSSTPSSGELTFSQMSTVYYARARYYNIGASHSPCVESATALIVLSLREYGAGRSTEAGRYCWSACRMALDLGLHRCGELSQSSNRSFKEEETRKRVYWCAYVLDKTLAAQMGRPPILRSLESDCPLPTYSEEEDELTTWDQMKHNSYPGTAMTELQGKRIGLSSYFINGCKLAVIAESIVAQYNIVRSKQDQRDQGKTISQLHADLQEWMDNTPRHLSWSPQDREGHLPYILHQQIWGQICMILIHRPYILKGSGASHLNSHAICSKATELTCGMFEEHERSFGFHSLPSGSVYCLFTAATIALANTTSTEPSTAAAAKHQLQQCIAWLSSLSKLWKSASDHVYILEKLACGIDPSLADEIMAASERAGRRRERSIGGVKSKSDNEKNADLSTYPSSNRAVKEVDDYSASQAPSIEAFWNDMPLGEDFDRWASFTQSYFKSPNFDEANATQKATSLADLMTPSEGMPPPRGYAHTTNPYLPIYGAVNTSRP